KEESRQYEGSKDSDNSCYGDVESLSSDSFEQTSDSEGDRSEMFSKGNVFQMSVTFENFALNTVRLFVLFCFVLFCFFFLNIENKKDTHSWVNKDDIVLEERVNEDRTSQFRNRLVTVLRGCLMSVKEVNGKGRCDKIQRLWKESHAFKINAHILSTPAEDIPRHLSTMHERWITQLQFNQYPAENTQQWLSVILQRMLLDPDEGGSISLNQPAVTSESNSVQGDNNLPYTGDATSVNEVSTMRRKSLDQALNPCNCTTFEVWVLTCLYPPTRKAVFIYVADRKGVFPPESWFEDEDCELMIKGLNCQRWRDNLVTDKGKRMQEQPGI
ncbi:unnamed protein product, partial [Porites evermanni]